ncbi:Protein orai-2 [Chamberlinius hualienensis]
MLALMISTCILPDIEAISSVHNANYNNNTNLDLISESPHEKMRCYIEIAWTFSTLFGILLFLIEIGLLSWVKFLSYSLQAAIVSTAILVVTVIVFLSFAILFFRKLVSHKCENQKLSLAEVEDLAKNVNEDLSMPMPFVTNHVIKYVPLRNAVCVV